MIEYMTLEQMRQQVGRHIGNLTSASKTRMDEWINTEYHELAKEQIWPQLVRDRETGVTFTAGEKFLYLPKDVQQLLVILPDNEPAIAVNEAIALFLDRQNSDRNATGTVRTWADAGDYGRKADFSLTAEKLTITPTGTDTLDVRVRGILNTDDEVLETVQITNGVPADTANTYVDMIAVSTNGGQTGVVTISGKTSGTEYASIAQDERTARYKRMRLHWVPQDSSTAVLYYKKRINRLVNDDDMPEIPTSHVIVHRVCAGQFSHQRKWGPAARYHEAKADALLTRVVGEEIHQGEKIEQGVPLGIRRNRRLWTVAP